MIPWAKSVAADVARDFYEWQFNFEPTLEFFEAHSEAGEVSNDFHAIYP